MSDLILPRALPSTHKGYIPCEVKDILREIDAALERLGLSARAASIRAQGAPEMIRDMRRGHVPSVQRLRALCEVLDLEFYVGPARKRRDDDEIPIGSMLDFLLRTLELAARDLMRVRAETGGNPTSDNLWSLLVAKQASKLLPTESESMSPDAGSRDERRREAAKGDGEQWLPEAYEARGWIDKISFMMHGLDPANCKVFEIRDGYMEPTLPNGCYILVDCASIDWQPPRIMAVRIGASVIARRAAIGDDGRRLMVSDHPDWPVVPLPASSEVIGEVRWASFWLNRTSSAGKQVEGTPTFSPSQDRGNLAG